MNPITLKINFIFSLTKSNKNVIIYLTTKVTFPNIKSIFFLFLKNKNFCNILFIFYIILPFGKKYSISKLIIKYINIQNNKSKAGNKCDKNTNTL